MTLLSQLPALIKVGAVFVVVLYAIRRRLSLGNAFMIGTAVLAILFALSPLEMVGSAVNAVVYPKTLCLAIIVSLILVLSSSMEAAGQMHRLLESFQGLVSSAKLNLVIFPALIGLLPMPGGAVFSAPMVKELGRSSKISRARLSFINYWFRHIWEYCWPMYPGVLLATIMGDLHLAVFVVVLSPLTVMAVYLGWRPIKSLENSEESLSMKRPPLKPFLKELLPILIVIVPGLSLGLIFSYTMPKLTVAKEMGLVISLCLGVGWIWWENRFTGRRIGRVLGSESILKMVYMVFAILIFKEILQDSDAVGEISNELIALRIPIFLITATLPFVVGVITGITIAVVGSTFPILIPLVHSHGEAGFMVGYVMLALVSGFAGVLLSPLHLCLILSNEYFETVSGPVYRYLWLPCLGLLISGMLYFWLLYGLYKWI
jgi:uncharacterized protein